MLYLQVDILILIQILYYLTEICKKDNGKLQNLN